MSSYTYAEAFTMSDIGQSKSIQESKICHIINLAQNVIWKKFDWIWTIDTLNPFWLIPLQQDYGSPMLSVPEDFERLHKAEIVMLYQGPQPRIDPMEIKKELNLTDRTSVPKQISYVPQTNVLRVSPCPSQSMACPDYMIRSTYKKVPTLVTPLNLQNTNIPCKDHQVQMYVEGIKWAYLYLTNSPLAQQIKMTRSGPEVTGKIAEFMYCLWEEARNEGLTQGDPVIAPNESLRIGTSLNNGFWYQN